VGYATANTETADQESANRELGWKVFSIFAIPGAGVAVFGIAIKARSVDRYETVRGPAVVRPPQPVTIERRF
jgi:hypothetical protein